jgi:DNA-binding transcriptional regulator YiaG
VKKAKRERLEAAGWSIGGAKEFLGLSAAEESLVEIKLALSESLRALRQAQRVTQVALARKLQSSQSRVAKMEAGDPSVSMDLLFRSLIVLGARPKEIARVIERPVKAAV